MSNSQEEDSDEGQRKQEDGEKGKHGVKNKTGRGKKKAKLLFPARAHENRQLD